MATESITIGIVIFPQVEELDFVGPYEVFAGLFSGNGGGRALLIAERDEPVECAKGMRVLPHATFETAPHLDVLLVPGGQGTRSEVDNPTLIDFLKKAGDAATWVTSVCTGALLLHEAGFAKGKRVTTYHGFVEALRARGDIQVLEGPRYVRDGNLVTSAGVSAGIDMALWLVGQLYTPAVARQVQRGIQYDPAPPYQAEV